MSSFAEVLVDMGFPKEKVERALEMTGNQGVEPAMEWLLAHGDEMDLSEATNNSVTGGTETQPAVSASSASEGASTSTGAAEEPNSAKSLKCDECGKLFKSQVEVEFHAAKSGHSQFSESTEEKKPLTEEEKQKQLALLEQKLKEKKKEREQKEQEEALEREKNRIRSGKEYVAIRKKMEDEDLKKIVEQRKKEKEEDKLARQKIIQQIEADKLARKQRASQAAGEAIPTPKPPEVVSKPSQHTKDYTETRIQIRLTNGNALTQTFGVKEQLSAVRLFVEMNRTDGSEPFSLMTSFPRKVFTEEDFDKPLDILGLVPSAVIIVTKIAKSNPY